MSNHTPTPQVHAAITPTMTLHTGNTFTLEAAEELAASCRLACEDGWTYEVEAAGARYQVVAYEDDGYRIGAI